LGTGAECKPSTAPTCGGGGPAQGDVLMFLRILCSLVQPGRSMSDLHQSTGAEPVWICVTCGGHFPGSAALHVSAAADGRGALLTGDTIMVTPGCDRVTFMWSAPNRLPLPERAVRAAVAATAPFEFDRIYGGWWTTVLH